MRSKILCSHLTCNVAKKRLNLRERVEVTERNKDGPLFFHAVRELLVSVKTLIQKNILRERMVVVVKMEDMLSYNHLQWYGNVIY